MPHCKIHGLIASNSLYNERSRCFGGQRVTFCCLFFSFFLSDDTATGISSGVTAAAIILIVTLARLNKGKKRIVITDYRRGVRFVGGVFEGILEPGSYRYDTRKEQITIVDMRPQPIVIERLGFQGPGVRQGVISVGTELLVRNPHLAATTLREEIKDSYVIVRDTVRAVTGCQVFGAANDIPVVAEAITTAANQELSKFGMGISNVEITELWAGSPQLPTAGVSEVIQ